MNARCFLCGQQSPLELTMTADLKKSVCYDCKLGLFDARTSWSGSAEDGYVVRFETGKDGVFES